MKKGLLLIAALTVVAPGVALAAHGKAGLWNITMTMSMPDMPQMPPEAMAMMKARGMKMPGMDPITTQICMTQADVDNDTLPPSRNNEENCQPHILSKTATSMTADMVCTGRMQGTGHIEVSYAGPEHYSSSFSFKGAMEGHATAMSSTSKGDWVKADCGSVKPFVRKPQ
jgi:hypothetical protein